MKNFLYIACLFSLIIPRYGFSQCENRTLDFDGSNLDCIEVSAGGTYVSSFDGTIEFWFKSESTSSNTICNKEYIFTMDGLVKTSIYDCNGDLYLEEISAGCNNNLLLQSNIRNSWHHIAISFSPAGIEIFIDCVLVGVGSNCGLNLDDTMLLGADDLPPNVGETFTGKIDEFRVWNKPRTIAETMQTKVCVLPQNTPHLIGNLRFDQGVANQSTTYPANNNTSILYAVDEFGQLDGALVNFGLTGQSSNFICSDSPVIYPIYENVTPLITNYANRQDTLTSICSGDAIHICLVDTSGNAIPTGPEIDTVIWQFDDGSGWQDLDSTFNGLCFGLPGGFSIDCSTSNTGCSYYIIRAVIDIENTVGDSCLYYTDTVGLEIFCPLDGSISLNNGNECEIDSFELFGNITSPYPFMTIPSTNLTIDWFYTDGNGNISLPGFQNMTSANYGMVLAPPGQACLEANVSDSKSGKSITLSSCISVNLNPKCGTIVADTLNGSIELRSLSPLTYALCRGKDAVLQYDLPFLDCNPIWQYSFDNFLSVAGSLGASNSNQNTNIIPTSLWPPGADTIFYRVQCDPINMPSACDSCFSDTLAIGLPPSIPNTQIMGQDTFCCEDSILLEISPYVDSLDYAWYCNGQLISNPTDSLYANKSACYEVVVTDECGRSRTTDRKCVHACKVQPSISCPLNPNICPGPGESIYLSACNSFSSCGNIVTYQWGWDSGTLVSQNNCYLTHTPLPTGTTYSVTVTDSRGCTASTSLTITPCP